MPYYRETNFHNIYGYNDFVSRCNSFLENGEKMKNDKDNRVLEAIVSILHCTYAVLKTGDSYSVQFFPMNHEKEDYLLLNEDLNVIGGNLKAYRSSTPSDYQKTIDDIKTDCSYAEVVTMDYRCQPADGLIRITDITEKISTNKVAKRLCSKTIKKLSQFSNYFYDEDSLCDIIQSFNTDIKKLALA